MSYRLERTKHFMQRGSCMVFSPLSDWELVGDFESATHAGGYHVRQREALSQIPIMADHSQFAYEVRSNPDADSWLYKGWDI